MTAFNFKLEFANLITDGIKRGTIREELKRKGPRVFPGQQMQLYTGMRHKSCRKLRSDVTCVETLDFEIESNAYVKCELQFSDLRVSMPELALLDGFQTAKEFMDFFPPVFKGYLYRWHIPVSARYAYPERWYSVFQYAHGMDTVPLAAPSGRRYYVLPYDTRLTGVVGLMWGIPQDWRIEL